MPNEKIYAHGHEDGSRGLKIAWHPGQTLTSPEQFNPGSVSIGVGDMTHEGLPTAEEDETGKYLSQFASFDRAALNRMIRTLRRARDQAYGADA